MTFLYTGVITTFFVELGKSEQKTLLLTFPEKKSPKIPEFSLICFMGMSVLCVALFVSNLNLGGLFRGFDLGEE